MAVDLVTVTGNLETLAGAAPLLGRVWFRISRADWTLSGEIFAPEYVEVIADSVTGAFSVDLQSTDDFEAGSTYAAVLKYREPLDAKDREFTIGTFALPSGGPYQLGDLMSVPVAAPVPADVLALCQAYAAATAADRVQTGLDRAATAADRVQTGLDRSASAASAAQAALYDGPWLDDVAAVLADMTFAYTAAPGKTVVTIGGYLRTRKEGFSYQFAASGASDQHVTMAGGVKLYVLPGGAGYNVRAFGTLGDGMEDDTAAIRSAVTAATYAELLFNPGDQHLVSSLILLTSGVKIRGNGAEIIVDPRNYTGGITRFYGVFSTVNITARPLQILWRIGTGTISFYDIEIEGLTFTPNRNGAVLSVGQMSVSDMNMIRFEDAQNCKVINCRFVDTMTFANNNGTADVYFVRSKYCEMSECYAVNNSLFWAVECEYLKVLQNYTPTSVGTALEFVAGTSHNIERNRVGEVWWGVSAIGVNSKHCQVKENTIEQSPLTGITLGHTTPSGDANTYSLPLDANFSTCSQNYILAGDTLTASHGYIGIIVQSASYARVEDNIITNLRKKTDLNDRASGVLVQPASAADATGLRIGGNRVATANNGIHIVRAAETTVYGNTVYDVYGGIHYEGTAEAIFSITDNFVDAAVRAISMSNGPATVARNHFTNISSADFSMVFTNGYFRFENNVMSECGEMYFGAVKSVSVVGNVFTNGSVKTRAGTISNGSTAGTAAMDKINIYDNIHAGTTDMVRLLGVLNQPTRTIERTDPAQFRLSSYNVGTLPTVDGEFGSEQVTNGDFASGSAGWTLGTGWSVTADATYTAATANSALSRTLVSAATAGTYVLRYTISANTLNAGNLRVGGLSGSSFYGASISVLPSTVGSHRVVLTCAPVGTGTIFDLWASNAATSGLITIDNISLKRLTGVLLIAGDIWNDAGTVKVVT